MEHDVGLVTVNDDPFALVVAADDRNTVRIRVGSDNEVGAQFGTEFHTEGHSLRVLGVRRNDSREVTVDHHLLGHYVDVLESPAAETHRHDLTSGTVHRGVNDIEVFLTQDGVLVDHNALNRHHVVVVHLTTDDLDEILVSLPFHVREGYFIHLFDDTLVMRLEHLRTILPVSLVSVVLFRVVGRGDVHTTLAFEMTDSERALRCRAEGLEEVHLDAVRGEDVRYGLGEETTVVTAVVTNHNRYAAVLYILESTLFLHFEQVVRVTLGSHGYDVFIHTVGTRAHNTAKSASTEFEGTIESIDEFGLILRFHHRFHLCAGLSVKRFAGPYFRDLHYFFQFFIHGK